MDWRAILGWSIALLVGLVVLRLIKAAYQRVSTEINLVLAHFSRSAGIERGDTDAINWSLGRLHVALQSKHLTKERRAGILSLIGHNQQAIYHIAGDIESLRRAIQTCRTALLTSPGSSAGLGAHLALASMYVQLAEHERSNLRLYDRAVHHCDQAIDATSSRSAFRADAMKSKADALQRKYSLTGNKADIKAAERSIRGAVEIIQDPDKSSAELLDRLGEYGRASFTMSLAGCLMQRYYGTGSLADIDEMVSLCREVAEIKKFPSGNDRAKALGNYSMALRFLYVRDGQSATLSHAIRQAEEALGAITPGNPARLVFARDLGMLYFMRYRRTDDDRDLDSAIDTVSEIQGATDAIVPAPMWTDVGLCYIARATEQGSEDDLRLGVQAYESAVRASYPGLERAQCLSNMAYAYLRFAFEGTRNGSVDEVSEIRAVRTARGIFDFAISEFQQHAIEVLPPTILGLSSCLLRLIAEQAYSEIEQDRQRLLTICSNRGDGIQTEYSLETRVFLRVYSGHAHALGGDWGLATDEFEDALVMLRELAAIGVTWSDIAHRLAYFAPFVSDAVVAAANSGDNLRGLRLIELGRSIINSSSMVFQYDLQRLRTEHPEIALLLDQAARGQAAATDPFGEVASLAPISRADVRDLLTQVRALPGFNEFGTINTIVELQRLEPGQCVTVLAASMHGVLALVVTRTGIKTIRLDQLAFREVVERANDFLASVVVFEDGTSNDTEVASAEGTFGSLLAWGWKKLAEPVLREWEQLQDSNDGTDRLRIWWCPLGQLSLLPIHAFGLPDSPGNSVLDLVVSSYCSTIGSLLQRSRVVRQQCRAPRVTAFLVDALSSDSWPLVGAREEIETLQARYPATVLLQREEVTVARTLQELQSADVAHFSCHGFQAVDGSMLPGLVLHDGPLTADIIAEQRVGGALAFASACSTAAGQATTPDEVLTLAAGLQSAGYQHVVGSLWATADALGPPLIYSFYNHVIKEDGIWDFDSAAVALHNATVTLRDITRDRPIYWAAYVHYGT